MSEGVTAVRDRYFDSRMGSDAGLNKIPGRTLVVLPLGRLLDASASVLVWAGSVIENPESSWSGGSSVGVPLRVDPWLGRRSVANMKLVEELDVGFMNVLTIDTDVFIVYTMWHERTAGIRRRTETHQRLFQGITGLRGPINSPLLSKWGSGLPKFVESDSGFSYRWVTPPIEESVPQADAAVLTSSNTLSTDGRSARWACQQSSSNFHTLSERPSSGAFAGFEGLSPLNTLKTTWGSGTLPNGSVPVSTYVG